MSSFSSSMLAAATVSSVNTGGASTAKMTFTEELGSEVNVIFAVDAPPVLTEDTVAAASIEEENDDISLIADTRDQARFCARVDARTRAAAGGSIRLSVDPARFH